MEVTFSHVANVAPFDHLMDIPTHLGRIKVLLEYFKDFVDAKMTD